ncbi:Uncharacterised protein [Salmonella enterica subsp. enterica serovar Typhimurium]|nr:Uncharacterised protein [Salmonella enterica subsp. enterica serovar Typhimurium]
MQCSGDVSLRARVRKRGRNLKPAKDANRFTVGGGNQVAANDYRKEQEIKEEMTCAAPMRVKRE